MMSISGAKKLIKHLKNLNAHEHFTNLYGAALGQFLLLTGVRVIMTSITLATPY